VRIIYKILMTK